MRCSTASRGRHTTSTETTTSRSGSGLRTSPNGKSLSTRGHRRRITSTKLQRRPCGKCQQDTRRARRPRTLHRPLAVALPKRVRRARHRLRLHKRRFVRGQRVQRRHCVCVQQSVQRHRVRAQLPTTPKVTMLQKPCRMIREMCSAIRERIQYNGTRVQHKRVLIQTKFDFLFNFFSVAFFEVVRTKREDDCIFLPFYVSPSVCCLLITLECFSTQNTHCFAVYDQSNGGCTQREHLGGLLGRRR